MRHYTLRRLMAHVAITATVCALAAWAVRAAQEARRAALSSACAGHLSQIALGLHSYHEVYGRFPPAYLADARGRPEHSWRVLILPYIEQQAIYNRYNFQEPWDGPHNRELAPLMPVPYACPNHRGDAGGRRYQGNVWTSYLAVTGPGTVFPGAGTVSLVDVSDRRGATIMVAEVADADVHWMEPRDLDVATMSFKIGGPPPPSVSSLDAGGPHAVTVDGSVRQLSPTTAPRELKALTTIAGGEEVAPLP
jgi:hypothetical protein